MNMARSTVEKLFISPMLLAYEPPKNVAGSPNMEDALQSLILDAAMASVPHDWPLERVEVYAQRLWDECLLGKKYTAGWPQVDQVRKAGQGIVEDMTAHDVRQVEAPSEVRECFPSLYRKFRDQHDVDVENDAWCQERKRAWMAKFNRPWPDEATPERAGPPTDEDKARVRAIIRPWLRDTADGETVA